MAIRCYFKCFTIELVHYLFFLKILNICNNSNLVADFPTEKN